MTKQILKQRLTTRYPKSENVDTERAEGLDDEKHSDEQTKSEEESAE